MLSADQMLQGLRGVNFLTSSLDYWPQNCVNLLYARKIA
jgi:hypothetical protein